MGSKAYWNSTERSHHHKSLHSNIGKDIRSPNRCPKAGVETTLIYKEGELSNKERKRFSEIENLNLFFHPNIHSKCMYNEKYFLLTSMNLYEYSQKHNREMGVVFRRTDEEGIGWNDYRLGKDDESIFQDAIAEFQSILNSSEFETSCYWMPSSNLDDLGYYSNCGDAVHEARRRHPFKNINGCYFCSKTCHTS